MCIFMASQIHILVPIGVNTPGDLVVELHFVRVHHSTYINFRQCLGFCDRPFDGAVIL